MMKRIIITAMCFACCAIIKAQQAKIGFFSMQDLLNADTIYQEALANVQQLQQQYAGEQALAEKEFKEKYELFLEQQGSLSPSIRQKRQEDLQSLLERTEKFRKESQRLIQSMESDALSAAKIRIYDIVQKTAGEREYLMIVNTDSEACPYINPQYSEDITDVLSSIPVPDNIQQPQAENH